MKENMPNVIDTEKKVPTSEVEEGPKEDNVESIKDLASKAVDNEAVLAEEQEKVAGGEYKEVLKSVQEVEVTPETIKQTIAEHKQRIEDWKSLTTVQITDSGMGGLGRFTMGSNMQAMVKRYPGVEAVVTQLQAAEKKNSVGWKVWKTPELDDYQLRLIKNYLTTGSLGNFSTAERETEAQQFVTEYLADNKVELAEGEKESVRAENFAQAILGDKSMTYYQEEIESLEGKLAA